MGSKKEFKVCGWSKTVGKKTHFVYENDIEACVRQSYDSTNCIKNHVNETCDVFVLQRCPSDNMQRHWFILGFENTFDVLIDLDNKWKKTDESYNVHNEFLEHEYDKNIEIEKEIKNAVNNGGIITSENWESCNLSDDNKRILTTRRAYPMWKPFTIFYNCVFKRDNREYPTIYSAILFRTEQYEIKLLTRCVPVMGRADQEDYYDIHEFKTISNKTTGKSVKTFYNRTPDIKCFIDYDVRIKFQRTEPIQLKKEEASVPQNNEPIQPNNEPLESQTDEQPKQHVDRRKMFEELFK